MRAPRTLYGALALALVSAAAGVAGGASPPSPNTGHAVTTIQLPQITLIDPTGVAHVVDLGSLVADARTDASDEASLDLGGGSVLGTPLPAWHVDSGGGPVTGDASVPLAAPGVTGGLALVGYDVSAAPGTARSTFGALTGTVTAAPIQVDVDLGQHGVDAAVGASSSTGTVALTVSGVQIGLGDLLPPDVLDAMPLSGLIDVVSALGLGLPPGAGGVVAQLDDLSTQLTDIDNSAAGLSAAQASLGALLAALPTTAAAQQDLEDAQAQLATDLAALAAAQQQLGADTATAQSVTDELADLQAAVDAAQQDLDDANATLATLIAQLASPLTIAVAQAQVTTAQAALDAAEAAVPPVQQQLDQANDAVTVDEAAITNLQQQVTADQDAVTAAQQTLDALVAAINNNQAVADAEALVTSWTTMLTDLVTQLGTDVAALPDLALLRGQLVDALAAAPLLDLGTLGATLSASADDGSAAGVVSCTVSGASVLGMPTPAGPCSSLVAQFAPAQAALAGALAELPMTAAVVPDLDGLDESSTGAAPASTDTTTDASAGLTALHVGLPQATLAALPDAAVTGLIALLGPAQTALAGLGLPAVTSALTGAVGTLTTSLSALPTGSALAGLHTVGVNVSLVAMTATAVHVRSLPASPGNGGPGDGGGLNSGGGTTDPGAATGLVPRVHPPRDLTPAAEPTPRVTRHSALPFTGTNSALDLAAGLVVLLLGAHLVAAARN